MATAESATDMNQLQKFRFAVIVTCFAAAFLLIYRQDVLGSVLSPLCWATARLTVTLLRFTGIEAARTAAMIYQPEGFAYEIHYTCTGILPVIILAVSIFACPGSFRSRLSGSVLGAVVLLMVNQLRLVCLFYAGVYMARGTFDFAHSVLGNCLMALATLAMWWVLTRRKNTASTRSESVGCLLEKRAAD